MSAPTTITDLVGHLVEPYKLVELMRGSSHAAVYRAIDLTAASSSSGRHDRSSDRAIKVLPKSDAVTGSLEIGLHSLVSGHPNIITMKDAFEDEDYYYLVLDICLGGDLHTKIWDEHLFDHNDELVRSAFIQVVDAVEACHAASVYHRDIKPENILCSEDGSEVYLCDFGLARGRPISREFGSGTTNYMSPECLAEDIGRMPYTNARHDIWALGVVLVNMITASHPWSRASTEDDQFYDYLCDPNFLLDKFDISEGANDILRRIFVLNPMGRITLPELRASVLELGSFFRPNHTPNDKADGPSDVDDLPFPLIIVVDEEPVSSDEKPASPGETPYIFPTSDVACGPIKPFHNPAELDYRAVDAFFRSFSVESDLDEPPVCSRSSSNSSTGSNDSDGPITPADVCGGLEVNVYEGRFMEELKGLSIIPVPKSVHPSKGKSKRLTRLPLLDAAEDFCIS